MFSFSLRASLIALVASVVAVSAAPSTTPDVDLTVRLGDGSEDMKVITTVANTGSKPVKLFKDPRGVLSPFPEDSFTITGPTGSRPSFNGAKAKYNPKYAVGLDDPKAYTFLDPGDTIDVTHDLTKAYDFTKSGTGEYSVEPSNRFTIIGADGTPKDIYATVGKSAKVKLTGGLPASRVHNKRATYDSCSTDQQSQLETAADDAQTYANDTYSYIANISNGTARYTTWFGEYDEDLKSIVENHFDLINANDFSSNFTYDCSCTETYVAGWVYPNLYGTIYLCSPFWDAPPTGTDSKAGTLVHLISHFTVNGGTDDYAFGKSDCQDLASHDPAAAVHNADNHQYFVENTPEQD